MTGIATGTQIGIKIGTAKGIVTGIGIGIGIRERPGIGIGIGIGIEIGNRNRDWDTTMDRETPRERE